MPFMNLGASPSGSGSLWLQQQPDVQAFCGSAAGAIAVSGRSLLKCLSVKETAIPAATAVKNATTGRMTVMSGSSSAHDTATESTPVSGVEMRNEVTAPFPAPCFFSPAAAGSTPQLQRGMGTPIAAALKIEAMLPPPR